MLMNLQLDEQNNSDIIFFNCFLLYDKNKYLHSQQR